MTKLRVFQWRLAATMVALLTVVVIIRLVWFPGPYFAILGATKLVLILVGANLVIGPGLTTLVYRPGKSGLVFDLIVIAAVEVIALSLAVGMIYERRPFYTVFAVDRFEVVMRREVDLANVGYDELTSKPAHAPRLVYAELPVDPEAYSQLLDDVVFNGMQDIDRRPEFWRPYAAGIDAIKANASPLSKLLNGSDLRSGPVQKWLLQQSGHVDDYVYFPLRGRNRDVAMIVHADIGYPVGTIDVDPW